jgi:cell division protein FtsA
MVLEKFKKARKGLDDDYIVALDIGTEFVKALIAKLDGEELQIVGVGRCRQEVSDMHSGAIADIAGVVRNCETALAISAIAPACMSPSSW